MPKKGLSCPTWVSDNTQPCFIPAGIPGDTFQKEEKPAPQVSAPTVQLAQWYPVVLVTWTTWPGHFRGDSLALLCFPFK